LVDVAEHRNDGKRKHRGTAMTTSSASEVVEVRSAGPGKVTLLVRETVETTQRGSGTLGTVWMDAEHARQMARMLDEAAARAEARTTIEHVVVEEGWATVVRGER
jgi:hypothetical protein